MRTLHKWSDAAASQMEQFPLLGQLQSSTRKGLLIGLTAALLLFLLLGGILGSLNRGPSGAVIGALSGALLGSVLGGAVGAYLGTRYLPQQGYAALAIELDDSSARFAPGEVVSGHVRVKAENTLRVSGGKAYFACRGFYMVDTVDEDGSAPLDFVRESRQYLLLEASLVPPGIIRRGASYLHPFRFTLPDDVLPSHYGYVCSVRWTVHAALDAPDIPRFTAQREVVVEAEPPVLPAARTEYQSTVSAQVCQVTLSLPRAVYAQGEQVQGRAHLTALESFEADEIHAVLVRVETAALGDGHTVYVHEWDQDSPFFRGERRCGGEGTTYVWLDRTTVLDRDVGFKVAETTSYPFAIEIPMDWRPTFSTKDGKVVWKVGVIIIRSDRSVRVFHEIIVHTGEPQATTVPSPQPSGFDGSLLSQ